MSTEPGHSNSETHLKQDGTPDERFKEHGGGSHGQQGVGFEEEGDGRSRLVTEGSSEDGAYKPSQHGGQKKDGGEDKRTSSEHGFGECGDRERASEAGSKGGSASYDNGGLTQ
ncbi:hypothetical protein BCR39DRAFT_556073 [Naematelia encephala]|uniref:Uncharacterized protein n=1 Tax=Naematelia encephala TaxID=71784 RepID=A0A1Y2BKC9_9TREE|nr:hypothetical protein BCR39DRAFT_556073 [Naematelia encephala]